MATPVISFDFSAFTQLTIDDYIKGNYCTNDFSYFDSSNGLRFDMLVSAQQQGTQGIHQLLRMQLTETINEWDQADIFSTDDFDEDELAFITPKADALLKKLGLENGVETEGIELYKFEDRVLSEFGLAYAGADNYFDNEYYIVNGDGTMFIYYLDGGGFIPAFMVVSGDGK